MTRVILIMHLFVTLIMCAVVLLQKSDGGNGPLGTSNSNNLMSSRQTGNLLTRITAFLAVVFVTTSLTLSIFGGKDKSDQSILNQKESQEKQDVQHLLPLTSSKIPNILEKEKEQR